MTKLTHHISACSLTIAALFFTPLAWSMRCGTYVIDSGMPKIEVRQKCGEPSSIETRTERRIIRVRNDSTRRYRDSDMTSEINRNRDSVEVEREIEIVIDEWIYNFGPHQFMQKVLFENGNVILIKDLGYGK